MTIEAGTRIGKYEVQSLIGEGGMGLVYRALDTELRRPVALKFLPAEVAADPRRLERFGREALAASALNHPNIVTVYDIGQTTDGRRFFATEFVDGSTLRAHLESHRLKLGEALDLVAQAAAALVEAHGQGIVHRDVKPENVMVRRDGYVKVNDSNQYDSLSLTGDGKTLVATQSERRSNVWVVTGGDYARARQLTSGRENGNSGCAWTPDGRVVYTSRASGYLDIWVMNADGGGPRQLTFGTDANTYPSVSADGRFIVFESNRGVGWGVWRVNADGGAPKELARNTGEYSFPQVSPDGQWVFDAASDPSGQRVMWRVPIEGGAPEQLTQKDTGPAALSPDGKLMLYYYRKSPDAPPKIEIAPATGGAPVQLLDSPKDTHNVSWSPDGRALVVVKETDGVSNLWTLPLDGGRARQLTDWKSDKIFWVSWSRDGRQLAVARGDTFYDAVLIKDFR